MTYPRVYNRQANFQNFQATQPTAPLPGASVDAEFNEVKLALDAIEAFQKIIQRSDGALANGIVTNDSFSPGLSVGFTFRGVWSVGVNFIVGDGTSYGTKWYRANVANLSSNANRPDLDAVTWTLVADFTAAISNATIADGAVTTQKIADGAVTQQKLATSSVGSAQIIDASVANGDLANVATQTIKGRTSAGTGSPEDLTPAQARNVLGFDLQGETTVASAATADIGAAPTRKVAISGSTAITSFGTVANQEKIVRFTGTLVLTHNASTLILPGAANITTAAGDEAFVVSDASGAWRVVSYTKADGTALVVITGLDAVTRRNLMLGYGRQAKAIGAAQRFQDSFADGYAANDGINTGASSGYAVDGTSKRVAPSTTVTQILQNAGTAIGSLTAGGGLAAAFDSTTSQSASASASVATSVTGYGNTVGKNWGAGVTKNLGRVRIYGPSDNSILGSNITTPFKIQGSTDGTNWTDLYTGVTLSTNAQVLDITSGITPGPYQYHRVNITGNSTNSIFVAEVQFFDSVPDAMTLVTQAQTADAVPATIRALMDFEPVDSITLNTDFTIELSRDGGTTWTSATGALTQVATLGPNNTTTRRMVETTAISVAGQPSGSAVVARVKNANSKLLRIYALALTWST